MNNSPKNPVNPKKNLLFSIKDISNNDPFLDPSGKIFLNPLFDPLHSWGKNKNIFLLEDTDNSNNNNIKKKGSSFIMRLNSIIDDIRNERKQNAQNINPLYQ